METILILDDEVQMQNLIELFLSNEGYKIIKASSAQEASQYLSQCKIDLILLDIMMPYQDGFSYGMQILQTYDIPIIFLTALESNENKVKGLTMGAEDYIVKPFDASELIARIRIVLRRGQRQEMPNKQVKSKVLFLDKNSRQVRVKEQIIPLTLKEFDLLALFLEHPNKVFSRDELLHLLWGIDYFGSARTVDTHIKTLRIKLNQGFEGVGEQIKTVWGIGYRYEPIG